MVMPDNTLCAVLTANSGHFAQANQPDSARTCNARIWFRPALLAKIAGKWPNFARRAQISAYGDAVQFCGQSNEVAVKLCQSIGFEIIGEIGCIQHSQTPTNAYIYDR